MDLDRPEEAVVSGFRTGRCKWFNVDRGFGIIVPDDGGCDVFVHQSVIQMLGWRSLGDWEFVEFRSKGPFYSISRRHWKIYQH